MHFWLKERYKTSEYLRGVCAFGGPQWVLPSKRHIFVVEHECLRPGIVVHCSWCHLSYTTKC